MISNKDGKPYVSLPGEYGFCAFPVSYGKSGKFTFIVNEVGRVYKQDLGQDPAVAVTQWPSNEYGYSGWFQAN